MKTYQHTQNGQVIVMAMLAMSVVMTILGFCVAWQCFTSVPILLLNGLLFHSLTIEITDSELRWYFGPGLIGKRVPLPQITSPKVVRTTFLEGWGIHWTRFGWLYNVSGNDAVAIVMQNGKKFALGTDEPEKLAAALQNNTGIIKSFKAV